MSSDFIYNTDLINEDLTVNSDTFARCLNHTNFEILTKIYLEAGQNLFQNTDELVSVPKKYLEPPIHISHYQFTTELGPITKQYFSMLSLHNPLNITFDTMSPLAMFFNCDKISQAYNNFLLYFSRVPIFCKYGVELFTTNLYGIFYNDWIGIQSFFHYTFAAVHRIAEFRTRIKNTQPRYARNVRVMNQTEKDNIIYDISYSDGRFMGVNSPQANDWYLNRNDNLESSFNNDSCLKCIMEICMLGACWNDTHNYTLGNAAIFINLSPQGDLKFTGKYYRNSCSTFNDTQHILDFIFNKIKSDDKVRNDINNEIGWDLTTVDFGDFSPTYNHLYENTYSNQYYLEDYSVKNLFLCVNGLEEWYRSNFALFLAGIYGHYFDYVLKYFSVVQDMNTLNKEAQVFKMTYRDFTFVKYIGSPLAAYFYDFKTLPERNILLGYNLGNLSKCIQNGCLSVSDKVSYNTMYKTRSKALGLFPVVFQNINLTVSVSCWRSFKNLLGLMKTRQQRDLLMDHLNTYGRRCFTILDPYGIFLHFHNETKGLNPADR